MKIKIDQKILNNAIELAVLAVSNKPITPIIGCIILESNENSLIIKSSNVNFSIYQTINAEIIEEGQVALSAQSLRKVILSLKGELDLSIEDSYLTIKHETGQCRLIKNSNVEEFPNIEANIGECNPVSIAAKKIQTVLNSVLYSSAKDESKMIITGANFCIDTVSIKASATDGHRMAQVSLPLDKNKVGDTLAFTVPNKALIEINKIISATDENINCTISIYENIVAFTLPGIKILSSLLDGEYPQVSKLIPATFANEFFIERKSFLESLKRITNIADKKHKSIAINIDTKSCKAIMFTESENIGDATECIKIRPQTESIKTLNIGFNIEYLVEAVENTATDEIVIKCNEPLQPVVIYPVGGLLDQLSLIMPMQIQLSELKIETTEEKGIATTKQRKTTASKPKNRTTKKTVTA